MSKKELDMEILVKALDNKDNETLFNYTSDKIKEMNLQILKELRLPRETTITYMKKLNDYRYIDEIKDVKYGSFIKWIPIKNPEYLPLNTGGIICDIKILEEGITIVCKNFMHKHYQMKFDEVLLFQKLSTQELVLLSALDHLAK